MENPIMEKRQLRNYSRSYSNISADQGDSTEEHKSYSVRVAIFHKQMQVIFRDHSTSASQYINPRTRTCTASQSRWESNPIKWSGHHHLQGLRPKRSRRWPEVRRNVSALTAISRHPCHSPKRSWHVWGLFGLVALLSTVVKSSVSWRFGEYLPQFR